MNRISAYVSGAIGGLVLALGFMAFFGSFTSLDAVTIIDGVPTFSAGRASFGLLVVFLAVLGGVVIAGFAYVAGRARDPSAPRFAFGWLSIVGGALGGALGFAAVSMGVTIGGESISGMVTMPVAALVVSVAVAGLLAGAITAPIVDALARPSTFGEANAATPTSSVQFVSDMVAAIGVPVLSIAIGALLAVGLAELLLTADNSSVSVAIFAAVGALILGATALFATRPWDRSS